MNEIYNTIRLYENAIIFDTPRIISNTSKGGKRSIIKNFSLSSVRRLREAIAVYYIPNSYQVGITLTVPWRSFFTSSLTLYKESFNRFCVNLRREFPQIGGIFRHELQRRKMPHCHMLLYVPFNIDPLFFESFVLSLWLKACPLLDGRSKDFSKYGVQIKRITELPAIFKYLADHTSKKKQAQLGYEGKQWGFFNRKNLIKRSSYHVDVPLPGIVNIKRQLSRIYRYTKKSDCVFGYRKLRRRKNSKVCFYNPLTVLRVVNFFSKNLNLPIDNEKNF